MSGKGAFKGILVLGRNMMIGGERTGTCRKLKGRELGEG
jgi:hypothetical protein